MIDAAVFERELFLPELPGATPEAALAAMVDALVARGRAHHREVALATLLQRERLGSTALGGGVAVPHCRTTVAERLSLVVARSEAGIEFGAPDGEPVHLFFLILARPTGADSQYLPLVAEVVRAIRDGRRRKALLAAQSFAQVVRALEAASAAKETR